jgi:hypothetical protein
LLVWRSQRVTLSGLGERNVRRSFSELSAAGDRVEVRCPSLLPLPAKSRPVTPAVPLTGLNKSLEKCCAISYLYAQLDDPYGRGGESGH